MAQDNIIDYTSNHKKIDIIIGEEKGYASINEVFAAEEDGIEPTGEYFVYLVHPRRGTVKFSLEYNHEMKIWLPGDPVINALIEDTIFQKIVNELPKNRL